MTSPKESSANLKTSIPDFTGKYWWVLVGAGICMWLQGVVVIGCAAYQFNLLSMESEQSALLLFNWMNHGTDIGAQFFNLSQKLQTWSAVPFILGGYFRIVRGGNDD